MRWQKGVVEDFFDLRTGGTPSKSVKEYFENGAIPWLVSGDIHKWEINDCEGRISLEGLNNSNARWLPKGAVMMALNGQGKTRGTVALLEVEATCNQSLVAIIPRDKSILNSKFTLYQLHGKYQWLRKLTGDGGNERRGLNMRIIRKIPFDFPPLEEQERIVEVLDEAFAAIDKAKANIERNLTNARELFQSRLNDIFSTPSEDWEVKSLGELGKVSMCKRILKHQTTSEGDIPFFKIGTFGKSPNAFIDEKTYLSFKQKFSFPKKGDILISAAGTIGRRVIYDGEPAYFQDSNIVWIDNDEELVSNEYLYEFYGVCDWNPSKGATISRLYNADLRRIKIPFPKLLEQKNLVKKIVALRENYELVQSLYEEKLNNLSDLKQSILEQAFEGKLTEPVAA